MSNTVLLKAIKRVWLENGDRLTSGSYNLYMYSYPSTRDNMVVDVWSDLKVTFYFRDHPIVIHSNDMVPAYTSILDFIDKLSSMNKMLVEAITRLDNTKKKRERFAIKGFLNPSEGCSDIYTSTMAITSSYSHGITFELASCDHKTRINLYGSKTAVTFLTKLSDFILEIIDLCETTVAKNMEVLVNHDDCAKVSKSNRSACPQSVVTR